MKITINNKQYMLNESATILEIAKQNDIFIPTFCHVQNLQPLSTCWICVVEVYGRPNKLVPACSTQITDGMIIETDSEKVRKTRKMALELLLSDHVGDCVAPCSSEGCPAHIDIENFLKLEAEGKYKEAASLIRQKAPIPNILGRVCPKPCEKACRRNRVDEPVMIGVQKRYIAEKEWELGGPFFPSAAKQSGKKIAIIGCGPAGLTAAYYLTLSGHKVVIFEKNEKCGGMMRYGIPYYRLPEDVIDYELKSIIDKLGIDVRYNIEVGKDISFAELLKDFDVVGLAHGAQLSNKMGVEGEQYERVIPALQLLKDLAMYKDVNLGKDVLVVGGGHTAIDAARSAIRLGSDVTLLYRRTIKEMPAEDEVQEAIEEGLKVQFLTAPLKIKRKGGKLHLTCAKMELSEPDASGRRKPVQVAGSEFVLVADNIVTAIGQSVDSAMFEKDMLNEKGWLDIKPDRYQHNKLKNVFAAGDCLNGPDLVVTAVAGGKKMAEAIDNFLNNKDLAQPYVFNSKAGELYELPSDMFAGHDKIPRQKIELIKCEVRKDSFVEIEPSLSEEEFRQEAMRCLKCGCHEVEDCKLKQYSSMYEACQEAYAGERREYSKDFSHPDIHLEFDKCINCGACVKVCEEIKQFFIYGYVDRGFVSRIKPEFRRKLIGTKCDACGECAKVCPTAGVWHV